MNAALKEAIRRDLPGQPYPRLKRAHARWAARAARERFDQATGGPAFLSPALLPELAERYPAGAPYGYDPDSLARRGEERARRAAAQVPFDLTGARTLELGCGDGMVSFALSQRGAAAVGVDWRGDGFDPRAAGAGVSLVEADAGALPFGDGEFDVVVSYNAFEHFDDPEAVLAEAIRALRPGGQLALSFGPLYMAPRGLHAYRTVGVPYCQFLFERADLEEFAAERELAPIPFDTVNGWRPAEFRALFESHGGELRARQYEELPHVCGLELVAEYPSCFRAQTDRFDDLTTSTVEALFERLP